MKNAIKTTHDLDFETMPSPYDIFGDGHQMFRIGTCEGQWGSLKDCYYILSVINDKPNNGHFTDVLEWFGNSCKRDNKNLLILGCMNDRLYNHLVNKKGFIPLDKDKENVMKVFNWKSYQKLIEGGNQILEKETLKCI